MRHKVLNKMLGILLAFTMTLTCCLPMAAFASQPEVRMQGHTTATESATHVSRLTIDGVDAPQAGTPLDDEAVVSSAENESWEIPVLWVDPSLQLATQAAEGVSYLPALAFYLPSGYAVQGVDDAGGYTVTLSDELAELFGPEEAISVYDKASGITYILPASLRDLFAAKQEQAGQGPVADASNTSEVAIVRWETSSISTETEIVLGYPDNYLTRLVDIFCSQTAKDALSQADLEYLVDLIVNRLHPQAVNLLLDKFPAFHDAADNNEIGRQIGLYIYYENGDLDGDPVHEDAGDDVLAYVSGAHLEDNDTIHYRYVLALNVKSCTQLDDNGIPVLMKDGESACTLENTIVHELFHAMMDDYNRTGMAGTTSVENAITDFDNMTPEQTEAYQRVHYPLWFIEGTASSVENVYQYRLAYFNLLTQAVAGTDGSQTSFAEGSAEAIRTNYRSATLDGKPAHFELRYSYLAEDEDGNTVDGTACNYVSGYLAVLYLGELSARASEEIEPAISVDDDGNVSISSENIRLGLNSILERMHRGETLDEVINDISPVDADGAKLYADTAAFEKAFLVGEHDIADKNASLDFVTTFLGYMDKVGQTEGRTLEANGSILFDLDADFSTPLDRTVVDSTYTLQVTESNTCVDSTVPDDIALRGGGKSESGTEPSDSATPMPAAAKEAETNLPLAAKTGDMVTGSSATTGESTTGNDGQTEETPSGTAAKVTSAEQSD